MSRFFAQQEEEEEEMKEELQPVQEENNKKKRKKKKKNAEPLKETEKEEQPEDEKKGNKKKNKKKGAIALAAQKKLEEQKKKDDELRVKYTQLMSEFTNRFIVDYRNKIIDGFKELQNQLIAKMEREERKKQRQEQQLEEARKRIEEMNKQFQEQMKNQPQGEQEQKKKKKKKKINKADKKLAEKFNEDVHKFQQKEKEVKKEEVKEEKEEVKFDDVDDWEDLLDEEVKEEKVEEKKEEVVQEIQKVDPKEEQKQQEEYLNKDKDFADPLEFFHFESKYRSPIICIMGHVDTGKTKILDNIRKTKVQAGEEGGITQQIGASFFPNYKLREEVAKLDKKILDINVEIPGLLIIDTPGHESFANLRSRGSSLADFAIVVIDIMHSIEPQTIESLKMLIDRNTPFVIALNKIDRLYTWKSYNDESSYSSLMRQESFVRNLFNEKLKPCVGGLIKLEINSKLYWENDNPYEYYSMVPTSAMTGEGMSDLLGYIAHYTQTVLHDRILKNWEDFNATVMEVKKIEGMGTTIDIILKDGTLKVDDKIILSGFEGPIETTVKALLTPHPMKELRVKNEYLHHEEVRGSMGVKLMCVGLEKALAGSSVYKYNDEKEKQKYASMLEEDIKKVKKTIKLKKEGVGVAASTLGSLEALLVYLKQQKIPVSTVCIGDVNKNDLLRVLSPFVQDDKPCKKLEYLTMLCFDVKILPEAQKFAQTNKIHICQAKIIYHLFDGFMKRVSEIREMKKKEEGHLAIFPCVLKQVEVFNKKSPLILGVDVIKGILRIGTPLCVPTKEGLLLGTVESIQANHKNVQTARKKTGSVAIRINSNSKIQHGRQFDTEDDLVSQLTRQSIDKLKEHFRDEMTKEDWNLVRKLKTIFKID